MPDLLTVSQVAHVLQCSDDSVVRRFAKLPGIIDLGTQTTRKKRRYRVLRIPKDVVERYLAGKSGRIIRIDLPIKANRRRKSEAWEEKAILNLAKAALQNDCRDKKNLSANCGTSTTIGGSRPSKTMVKCSVVR